MCSESQAGGWKSHSLFVQPACLDLRSLTWDVLLPPFLRLIFIRVWRSAAGRLACTKCASDNCRYRMHVKPLTNGNLE